MFLVAYVPPLWFRVMNPRLLKTVGHDRRKISFLPRKRDALIRQYGIA